MRNVPKLEVEVPVVPRDPATAKSEAAETERRLVRRAQEGDQLAYEDLVRMHQQRLLAVVGGILRRNPEDVEDVAQQALVKAYFSLKRFDMRSAFGTWLYKIAVNECWDYFRKKKVRPLVYESSLTEDQLRHMQGELNSSDRNAFGGAATARQVEHRDLLDQLLGELDHKDRTMLVMKEAGGFTVEEIGEALDLNVNTVKVRLFRARGKLVEIYRRRLKNRAIMRPAKI